MDQRLQHTKFRINRIEGDFGIYVTYQNNTFCCCKGSLSYVKAQFIRIVNDRNLLLPVLDKIAAYMQAA